MTVLIQNIESIEIHRQKRNKQKTTKRKTTKTTTDKVVNGARRAFQCFVYNTNTITDPF